MFTFDSRVLAVHGPLFLVQTSGGEQLVPAAGRLREMPVVGDFVFLNNSRIEAVAERQSEVVRRAPGTAHARQVLCANIDWLFIVSGLDADFNPRRLERYMVIAAHCQARPAIVLTKADLCANAESSIVAAKEVAAGSPVFVTGLLDDASLDQIRSLLASGSTGALIGSSGAGKSTLLNRLTASHQQTVSEVRAWDHRGRHTTTHRQMFALESGGWIIDQPGLREIQLLSDETAVDDAFAEITQLAGQCRFRDCRHEKEPGCAVRGQVGDDRLNSYGKLRREAERAEEECDPVARRERRAKIKAMHKAMRGHYRD